MVIAFIINQARFIVILDNFRIGGIDNMAATEKEVKLSHEVKYLKRLENI